MNQSFENLRAAYGPWIDQLPGGSDLVLASNRLHQARDFASMGDALREIFVECLGFDEEPVQLARRFDGNKPIVDACQIARYDEFAVIAVEVNTNLPYPSIFAPVFSAFPYALVFTITPYARNVRVVFRQIRGDGSARVRGVRGARFTRAANDNILTWARRFALLRPEFRDTAQRLREKAHRALEADAEELGAEWESMPVDGATVPGPSWHETVSREMELFFQSGVEHEQRMHWGFAAALRNTFPLVVAKGAGRVECHGYSVRPDAGSSAYVVVDLDIVVCLREHDSMQCSLPARVPRPDASGAFELEGVLFQHQPEFEGGGVSFREVRAEDNGVDEDLGASVDLDDEEGEQDEADVEVDDEGDERSEGYRGASIGSLLTHLIERKIGRLSAVLWRARREQFEEPADVLKRLAGFVDGRGNLVIAAESLLRSALVPVKPTWRRRLRLLRGASVLPPAWACPELSAHLPDGRWYPVSGARLHPASTLAVPRLSGGSVILGTPPGSAFDANPRLSGVSVGSPQNWIAYPLKEFASLAVGQVDECAEIVGSAVEFVTDYAAISGEQFGAYVGRKVFEAVPSRETSLRQRVPAEKGRPPSWAVVNGQEVRAGMPWLTTNANTFPGWMPVPEHNVVRATARLVGIDKTESSAVFRIPNGVQGVVSQIEAVAVVGDYGTVAWDCVVRIVWRPTVKSVVLDDGRVAPVLGLIAEADVPWSPDGHVPEVVVHIPDFSGGETGYWTFDGLTGEAISTREARTVALVLDQPRREAPRHVQRSLLTGGGIELGDGVSLPAEQLQWLRVAHPRAARAIHQVEKRHFGAPARWERLIEALTAGAIDPPLAAPSGWRAKRVERSTVAVDYDPSRTSLKFVHSQGLARHHYATAREYDRARTRKVGTAFQGIVRVQCDCGALEGPHRQFEMCKDCGTRAAVAPLPLADSPLPVMRLPATFLHPWLFDEVAVALGIDVSQVESLIANHGGEHLVSAVAASFRREGRTLPEHLLLRELPLASPALRPQGLPVGAPTVLHSMLGTRYRDLVMTVEQYERLDEKAPDWLRADAWIGVQLRLGMLLGSPWGSEPAYDSIAALVRRLLWYGEDQPPISLPGLEELDEGNKGAPLGLVWNGVVHEVPRWKSGITPSNPHSWSRRSALHALRTRHLPFLAAVLGRFDGDAELDQWLFGQLPTGVIFADDLPGLGRMAAVTLFKLLEEDEASGEGLQMMLESKLPIMLPTAEAQALESFRARLHLGPSGPASEFVTLVLFWAFANWWSTEEGWSWSPGHSGQPAARRSVPPARSPAWRTWPETLFAKAPVKWLALGAPGHDALWALLGLDAPDVREIEGIAATSELQSTTANGAEAVQDAQDESPVEPVPPTHEPESETGLCHAAEQIRVLRTNAAEWLTALRGHP